MKRKIIIVSILAVFMLVAISYATAVNTTNTIDKKESPLWGIRTRKAIGEKINIIIENIKAKFLGERLFFIPFISLDFKRHGASECGYTNKNSFVSCQTYPTSCSGDVTYCDDCTSDPSKCETSWGFVTCFGLGLFCEEGGK